MAKLILSEASQKGIQGVTKRKSTMSDSYKKLVMEADKGIDEDHARYANAYRKASRFLAR